MNSQIELQYLLNHNMMDLQPVEEVIAQEITSLVNPFRATQRVRVVTKFVPGDETDMSK
jgi:hypothetical protein